MAEKRLPYDRGIVPQETGWWCGPAATQIVLNSRGIKVPEAKIAATIEEFENPGRGDDRDGTDYVGLIERFLDQQVPEAKYTSVYMPNDPPSAAQKDKLWRDLTKSINAGWGVVANIVAPPTNPPRAVKGSVPPPYPRFLTTYHYVALMGFDDTPSGRAVWVADSASFGGITGWWCPFDGRGSICSLIPPKGYCYADATPVVADPVVAPPKPENPPTAISAVLWDAVWRTHIEWLAFAHADPQAVEQIITLAKAGDSRAISALARLEHVNPAALEAFLMKG